MSTDRSQPPLLGRVGELIEIDAMLHALAFGDGRVLAISGEAGVGKTRLAEELARRADELGYTTLWGRGAEFQNDVPFSLLTDALDQLFAGSDLAHCEHQALRSRLEVAAWRTPLVLIFDDVHWGDDPSLELIGRLLARRPTGPILIVLTYRFKPSWQRLSQEIEAAARDGEVTTLDLAPLTFAEAARMCEDFKAADRASLYRESGGNPFYLEQLAHAWRAGRRRPAVERSSPEAIGDPDVPPMVRLAIADELRAVPRLARHVLRASAVLGEVVDAGPLAEVAGITVEEALAAIEELVARDLLRAGSAPGRAWFRHPVVRHAVYESTAALPRRSIHGRGAVMLERSGASLAAVAHHVERSAQVGDETAIARLIAAAEHGSPRAPLAAARWYEAALRLLPADADVQRRVGVQTALAVALASGGRTQEARDVLESALALVPSIPQASHAEMVASIARVYNMIGLGREVRDRVLGALGAADDERLGCELELALALDLWTSCEWDEMSHRMSSALERARALDDPALAVRAAASLALGDLERGAIEPAALAVGEARSWLAVVSDADIATGLEAFTFIGLVEARLERRRAVVEDLKRGLAIARATGQSYFLVALASLTAMAHIYVGELDEASEALEAAAEHDVRVADDYILMWPLALQCWISMLRGSATSALAAGRAAMAADERFSTPLAPQRGRCFYGRALIEAGDPEAGRAHIVAGAGGPELPRLPRSIRSEWYATLTEAELALGCVDAAEDTVSRAEASAAGLPMVGARAYAQLARAAVLLARSDFADASDVALEAAASFDAIDQRIDGARSRTIAARALATRGRTEGAIELLRQAAADLGSVGALRYHDDALRELRRLGVHEPDPASARADGSTLADTAEVRPTPPDRIGGPVSFTLDSELFELTFGGTGDGA